MDNSANPGPFKRDLATSIEPPPSEQRTSAAATKAIVLLNVLVFCSMAFVSHGQSLSGDDRLMRAWGSNFGPLVLSGEYYRLVTNLFLHWDVMHIGFNMWALWAIGQSVEELYGSSKFLVMYLLSGIAGSLASLLMHPHTDSAGASGAIFGVFGAFLVFLKLKENQLNRTAARAATRSIIVLLIFNLVFGMTHAFIDNAAHVGGFIGGLLAGLTTCPKDVYSKKWSMSNLIATALLAAALYKFLQFDIQLNR
jgi:rhomboid protease GluP